MKSIFNSVVCSQAIRIVLCRKCRCCDSEQVVKVVGTADCLLDCLLEIGDTIALTGVFKVKKIYIYGMKSVIREFAG